MLCGNIWYKYTPQNNYFVFTLYLVLIQQCVKISNSKKSVVADKKTTKHNSEVENIVRDIIIYKFWLYKTSKSIAERSQYRKSFLGKASHSAFGESW